MQVIMDTFHLVNDLLDLKTNASTKINSNEHHKVIENESKEEEIKIAIEKENGHEAKGTRTELEKDST